MKGIAYQMNADTEAFVTRYREARSKHDRTTVQLMVVSNCCQLAPMPIIESPPGADVYWWVRCPCGNACQTRDAEPDA